MEMPKPDDGVIARRRAIATALREIVPGEGVIADEDALRPYASDGLTADLIDALRGISKRLEKIEDDRARAPAAAAPDGKPNAGEDAFGVGIDDDLLAALRSRRDAFADIVDADRGGAPRKSMDASAKDDSDAQLLADLQEAHRRVEKRAVDPISLLKKQIIKPINTGVVKTRMAPTYLVWFYNQNKNLRVVLRKFL